MPILVFVGPMVKKTMEFIDSGMISRSDNKLRWVQKDLLVNEKVVEIGVALRTYSRYYAKERTRKLATEYYNLCKSRKMVYTDPTLMMSFRILSPYYVQRVLTEPVRVDRGLFSPGPVLYFSKFSKFCLTDPLKGAIEKLVIAYGKPKKIGNDTYPPLIDRTNFRSEYKFLLSEMKNYDCCDSETETIFKFWNISRIHFLMLIVIVFGCLNGMWFWLFFSASTSF